jgi:hypothetical protein
LQRVPEELQAIAKRKIKEYFLVGRDEHVKLFRHWVRMEENGIALLATFSELPTGRLVAQRLLGLSLCANPYKIQFVDGAWISQESGVHQDFYDFKSPTHDRVIDLKKYAKFVEDMIPLGDYVSNSGT